MGKIFALLKFRGISSIRNALAKIKNPKTLHLASVYDIIRWITASKERWTEGGNVFQNVLKGDPQFHTATARVWPN